MATEQQIQDIRNNIDEQINAAPWTDEVLSAMVDSGLSVDTVSQKIWLSKAAKYSKLVDMREAGSSRSMGDLYKNALAMADRFKTADIIDGTDLSQRPRTRQIDRV